MRKYHIAYHSMTASYDMEYIYANSREAAEREARAKASAFDQKEKCLVKAYETDDSPNSVFFERVKK